MIILLPVLILLITALVLVILRLLRPKFRYPWMFAAGGSTLAFASVFLWQIHFMQSISLPSWQVVTAFSYFPAWLADDISWPYSLALTSLAMAVIWTSVVRAKNDPLSWAGTLALAGFGILAVAAENPITLILAWSAIDLFELVTMLRPTEGERQTEEVIIAFAVRLLGTGLVLWANLVSVASGTPMDFRSTPTVAGVYLLLAVGFRLGVLPLHLPYSKDTVIRREFGTALRLVSAAASLALLSRIPATALKSALTPYLLILAAIAALYAGWMWMRASDEIMGRPFWILSLASVAVAESLRGNSTGSTAWGVAMVLCGGTLFLFSARRRVIIYGLFVPALWGLTALPYSLTATAWQAVNSTNWLFAIPFLPAQALLAAGFIRHSIHAGETNLDVQQNWVKVIYPIGLMIMMATVVLLGFWGWIGARVIGSLWFALVVIFMATGLTILALRVLINYPSGALPTQWTQVFRLNWLFSILVVPYKILNRIADTITSFLEGEGGLLWTFLIVILILSILSARGH